MLPTPVIGDPVIGFLVIKVPLSLCDALALVASGPWTGCQILVLT